MTDKTALLRQALTALELACYGKHPPAPEAIAACNAIRDELAKPQAEPVIGSDAFTVWLEDYSASFPHADREHIREEMRNSWLAGYNTRGDEAAPQAQPTPEPVAINYTPLFDFAESNSVSYNELCKAVHESLLVSGKRFAFSETPQAPAVHLPDQRAAFDAYMDRTAPAYWRTTAHARDSWETWQAALSAAPAVPPDMVPKAKLRLECKPCGDAWLHMDAPSGNKASIKVLEDALREIYRTQYHIERPPIESLEQKMREIARAALETL